MKILKSIILTAGLFVSLLFAQVNINTASEEELTSLPGIGPAKAKAIVEYRKEHGNFKSVDELSNVSGIGEKTVKGLDKEATTSEPKS